MTYGLLSDIHYYNKPYRLRSALRLLKQCNTILIAGDIVDRGTELQFTDVLGILSEEMPDTAIFTVSGNHDTQKDFDIYRSFEEQLHNRFSYGYSIERSATGAYYTRIDSDTDLTCLNPLYYQKLFHFPDHGEQLNFLETHLRDSSAGHHIVMCHPPLIVHNPHRTVGMQPYLPKEQDQRLQEIVERYGNICFLSGHTHYAPTIEYDDGHHNIYINDGSVNPTTVGKNGETRPGNVFQFDCSGMIKCIEIRRGETS